MGTNVIPAVMPPSSLPPDLEALQRASTLLDEALTIPVINKKVGLDAFIGLVPGLGDVVGGVMSASVVVAALRHRVPAPVVLRMVANILVDMGVGTVPVVGDVLDFFVKNNVRNMELLLAHRDATQPPRAISQLGRAAILTAGGVLGLLAAACAALLGGSAWLLSRLLG
ncbi:MAG: DUF4112 domain-containing protein [Myxococcota bacterium]